MIVTTNLPKKLQKHYFAHNHNDSLSTIQMIRFQVSSDFDFPFVTILQQFFLIVKQLFARLRCIFKVGPLHNCVDGARLLTEATVDAFGHIDIVASGSSTTVSTVFGLDGDGLSWTNGLTKFARYTPLLAGRIPTKGVLPSKTWTQRSLFEWIIDGSWLLEHLAEHDEHATDEFAEHDAIDGFVGHILVGQLLLGIYIVVVALAQWR